MSEKIIGELKTRIFLKHIDLYIEKFGNPVDVYEAKVELEKQMYSLKHRLAKAEEHTAFRLLKHEIKMFFKNVFKE